MNAIIIMAKEPVPTCVKTRLTPPLDPETAASLYHIFLLDKFAQVSSIRDVRHFVAYTPDTAAGFFRRIVPCGFKLIEQTGADLGKRLANISGGLFEKGYKKVIMLDSDTPTLPLEYIKMGLEMLDTADVVVGPCEDGGYYLIGLTAPAPDLFKDIAWSTPDVTDMTVNKAKEAGLVVAMLGMWYDVDTVDDLRRLKKDLESAPRYGEGKLFCKNTYGAVSKLDI